MSWAVVAGIGVIGGVGALARFVLDGVVAGRTGRSFPWGTLVVNVSGALVLGALAGAAVTGDAYRLAGVGFIGSFTTFSTWMYETQRLAEEGQLSHGALNVVLSLATGVAAAAAGRSIGGWL